MAEKWVLREMKCATKKWQTLGALIRACGVQVLRFGPTGLGKSAWGNAPGFNGTNTFCPERATQTSIAEPCQGSCSDGTSTWGGVHPHSRILLPQADMREPFRLHRSTRFIDQRKRIFCASVTAHLISRRTGFCLAAGSRSCLPSRTFAARRTECGFQYCGTSNRKRFLRRPEIAIGEWFGRRSRRAAKSFPAERTYQRPACLPPDQQIFLA